VHVVWFDERDGNSEIYYKRSTDAGASWGEDTRLTNNSAFSSYPSVSVSGQVVHIVWRDFRDGNEEIYYKRSPDAGVSWGADTRLTNNSANSSSPSVSVSGQVVHIVWFDNRDGNDEIYYKRSTDGGVSWGADARLTNNSATSYSTSVSVSGQVVHVVWFDERDGNSEIYYKRSTDAGASWGADTRLTNNSANSFSPSVSVSGQVVHVVWSDNREGNNNEIYYKRSTDGGVSWGADTRLTNNSANSSYPSVSVSGQVVHVVWYDERDGNSEIYYKRDPTGNPFGIININSEIPKEFSLGQNYPNPFNPSTFIRFALSVAGMTNLKVYDILGREVATLVNEQLKPGTYEVVFNGTNYPSGVYYYVLKAGDFIENRKMVLIK
jgi:phage terminase large subunit-like protein